MLEGRQLLLIIIIVIVVLLLLHLLLVIVFPVGLDNRPPPTSRDAPSAAATACPSAIVQSGRYEEEASYACGIVCDGGRH